MRARRRSPLPGFGLSLGITAFGVGIVVLLPIAVLALKATSEGLGPLRAALTDPRALAAYRLSFGAAGVAALVNLVFGVLVAWVLVRERFWGRALVDALVDLPFALPTAVAGLVLTTLYAKTGLLGGWLAEVGIAVAFTPVGITIAMIFVGLPFVVRTVQPVIEDLDLAVEEAAATLGASRAQTFVRVIFPRLIPSALTGGTLAFARAMGEYGSLVFISGNRPMKTEIAPLLIVTKLEQYDYAGATAIAIVLLAGAFALLLVVNLLQRWSARRLGMAI